MFRDRQEELDRLEAALQNDDSEDTELPEEEFDEEFDEEFEEEFEEEYDEEYEEEDEPLPDFRAYNADHTDEDLEEFSEAVYRGREKNPMGLLVFMLVASCVVLLALAVFLLKYGGYLG